MCKLDNPKGKVDCPKKPTENTFFARSTLTRVKFGDDFRCDVKIIGQQRYFSYKLYDITQRMADLGTRLSELQGKVPLLADYLGDKNHGPRTDSAQKNSMLLPCGEH